MDLSRRMQMALPMLVFTLAIPATARRTGSASSLEFRAMWVDAFHAGIRTPPEALQLVANAKQANFNALIVQVRRRADAYYRQSFEPPAEDPDYDPSFDALAYIVELAHREHLEVYAWLNAMLVWSGQTPPRDPRHVFNQHGVTQSGENNWLTAAPNGEEKYRDGYYLDPGHPAAAEYLARVCINLVNNYQIDGIHLDFIRYPENVKIMEQGAPVGYNTTSVARFQRATGRQDTPLPNDSQWSEWRRQQITQVMRRIYLESKALKPRMRVSAALIAWGEPPSNEGDFERTAAMQVAFQDWHEWLKEGILDLAIPMDYVREDVPKVREWFNGWIRWEKRHKHGRQLAVGLGAYLNRPQDTLAQVRRVRQAEHGKTADGLSFFSYAHLMKASAPKATSSSALKAVAEPATPLPAISFFSESGAFAQKAVVPTPEWLATPRTGWIAGTVRGAGKPADGSWVVLRRSGWFHKTHRTQSDGNGFFGFSALKPGHYRLRAGSGKPVVVEVVAGKVALTEI
jgi:uncharacterized lipoprotein YddW (UPF0748 family)